MLEWAKEVTRRGEYTYLEYARYADDLVILVDGYRQHDWLLRAAHRRLREELAKLHLRVNEDKTRVVDLGQGESFGFLGFDFRRVRSRRGAWRSQYTPKLKQRTAVLQKLKAVFRRSDSQPIRRVIAEINPILRGWVAYFRVGHASRCFAYVKLWVEKKVRRAMMRARHRGGFGWARGSTAWLHEALGLFGDYRVQYRVHAESARRLIGRITLVAKLPGKRRTGNPFAPFEVAGAGNGLVRGYRASPRPDHLSKTVGAPSAARSTYREYASRAAFGRRLASGPFSAPCAVRCQRSRWTLLGTLLGGRGAGD